MYISCCATLYTIRVVFSTKVASPGVDALGLLTTLTRWEGNVTASIVNLPTHSRKQESLKQGPAKPLTALKVKNHKEGVIADAHPYRGLRLRANKNGTKTWFYRYKLDGKQKQIKLGLYPGVELAEAREALIEQRKIRDQHQDPRLLVEQKKAVARKQLQAAEQSEYTFAKMVEQYLSERVEKDRKVKGATEARRLMERDLGTLANIPVADVEPGDLHDFIRAIANRAPDVASRFRAELNRAWRYAINTGRTKTGCLLNTDTGGKLVQGKRTRWLKEAELQSLIPWLPNYSRTVEEILKLTLYLGLRSGEVCKLRDDWLTEEFDGWWVTIPANEMKKSNNGDHRVPLSGTALAIVNRRKGHGAWFPSRSGGSVKQKILGVEVYAHSGASSAKTYKNNRICPVSDWAPNDLRKTARSHLAALGCPFEVAESVLHHSIPGVGGLYNRHKYETEKRVWLTKLGQYFDGLGAE